jgi:putative FmdB family regulatory protein
LYAYRCTECGYLFEKIQKFSAEPELVCPECQGVLERPMTAPALRFKGSGWYVNDYAGKNAAPIAETAPAAKAPSTAGDSSAGTAAAAPAAAPAPVASPAS